MIPKTKHKSLLGQLTAWILPLILIGSLSLFLARSLLQPGLYTMHDDQQVIRLAELDSALSTGQFPARWVSRLGFGYGYPLFIFYPPLVYHLGYLFVLMGLSYISSIKLVITLSLFLSGIAAYYWASRHLSKPASLLVASFYLLAPYRAVDIFVRGALAEAFSFVWLPLILTAIERLILSTKPSFTKQLPQILLLSLSSSALIITHNLIALPFAFLSIAYGLILLIFYRKHLRTKLIHLTLSAILAIATSCFFWLPALFEKSHTLVDNILLTQKYSYTLHFAKLSQLWNSLWGYGGSAEPGSIDGFSLKIGKAALVFSLVAIGLALFKRSTTSKKNHQPILDLTLIYGLFLVVSIIMATSLSLPIWQLIKPLQYIQFPWRFITFMVLFTSVLVGIAYHFICTYFSKLPIKIILFVLFFLSTFIPHAKLFTPQFIRPVTDDYFLTDQFAKWQISKTSFEFIPKETATTIDPILNITQPAISETDIAIEPFKLSSQVATAALVFDRPHQKAIVINSTEPTTLTLNQFYFPGWKANINGTPLHIQPQSPLHLISVSVPSGTHTLTFEFTSTPIRHLANTITLISAIVTLTLAIHLLIRKSYA